MNNVKWERFFRYLVSKLSSNELFVLAKPVWSKGHERRIIYREDQITSRGILDPGIFGNDREEYEQIEYIKIIKEYSRLEEISKIKEFCIKNNIKFNESEKSLTILGYE